MTQQALIGQTSIHSQMHLFVRSKKKPNQKRNIRLELEKRKHVNSILAKIDDTLDAKDIKTIVNSLIKASKDDPETFAKTLRELMLIKE